MIVCGFPGTGKSTMARFSNWIDLDSTPFSRKNEWILYAEVAKYMSDNGYDVMVSTHEELLKALEQIEVQYIVVIPPPSDKDTYIRRYEQRGNSCEYILKIKENWNRWITNILYHSSLLKTVVMLPNDGCIQAWANKIRKKETRIC